MDPMDFLESKELLQFFHCHKTEMSCMENPHTFLRQLRDHNLIPEDRYEKVSRMKSKENLKKGLYGVLDWLERERSQHIHLFWRCALKETMMSLYPALRLLRNRLMDGSFQFDTQLPEKVEKDKEKEKSKRKEPSVDEEEEEEQVSSVKKKRKQRRSVCDNEEEQQPGPSSQLTQDSPLKKGEKSDLWNWPIYRFQLPVTCGSQEGTLCREKLAKGTCGKCIRTETSWLNPVEFMIMASVQTDATWRNDIMCEGRPLSALIEANVLRIHSLLCKCRLCKPDITDLEDDKNDDECCVCKEGVAVLVECENCPRSFHQKCHLPHVDDAILGADEKQIFALNPSLYLENYSTAVETPMWLGNVAGKLQKKEYQTVGDFVSDVQLIFSNCASYNRANPELLAMGDRLNKLFNKEFKKVFNISEQSAD
ncbi:hypothetical protein F2P81_014760 [Scophthalmus maximus]|uniref:Bromo domain-containing protein n=1 Tax=Scophthalmus maximus TaxID=52904 RepID=A0A6A4SKU3_SCOMX|nr:hypothetical protein F2P81_014760 [Scophthalmus maximus]